MSKKNNPLDDYQKIKNEMVVDAVNELFRKHPDTYIQKLEEIGFKYHEEEDTEKIEEDNSAPENDDQKLLVSYFDGEYDLSETILSAYLNGRQSDHPNYPLIRKYFKKANYRLKNLLLTGLDQSPANLFLLNDLAYFHEFENILELLVDRFTAAYQIEQHISNFMEMMEECYYSTILDGYDALAQLKQIFPSGTEKREHIELFCSELVKQNSEPDDIEF